MEGVKELELFDRELGLLQAGESLWLTSISFGFLSGTAKGWRCSERGDKFAGLNLLLGLENDIVEKKSISDTFVLVEYGLQSIYRSHQERHKKQLCTHANLRH